MEKSEGLCSVCFNEVDAIHSLVVVKSQTQKRQRGSGFMKTDSSEIDFASEIQGK